MRPHLHTPTAAACDAHEAHDDGYSGYIFVTRRWLVYRPGLSACWTKYALRPCPGPIVIIIRTIRT